ncbi:hypothetical protein [Providencia hangzhouensis]|uniref:hypothetical protein n=1 Tax=Providencia hangzhouensis TaxID=3031799 RepID=UPI0034DD0793
MSTLIIKDEPSSIIFRFNVENGNTAIAPIDDIKSARPSINADRETVIETHEGRSFKLPIYLHEFVAMVYWAREKALANVAPINYHIVDIYPHAYFDHIMKQVEFDKEFVMKLANNNGDDEIYTFLASSTKPASVIRQQFMKWIMEIDEKRTEYARNKNTH